MQDGDIGVDEGSSRLETHATAPAPRRRVVGAVLAVGALDLGLEQFIVVPILPAVQQAENASLTTSAWLITGFLLAAVAAAPILGRLGDMYGKRRLLLVSLGFFTAGSLVCALADSIELQIAGRVVQGIGAGLGPLAIGLARDHAPRNRAPLWIGLLVACSGAGAALGLLLGGVLVDYASVSAVFWSLFALAVALLVGVFLLVPESPVRDPKPPDWAGGASLTAALLAALLAVSQGNTWGWRSLAIVALLVVSAAMIAAFVVVERSARAPIVDLGLMARRPVWSANLVAFGMGFALFIASVVVPQIATLPEASGYGFGLTIAQTGLLLMPGALAIVLGGFGSGRLVRQTGSRPLLVGGAILASAGYAALVVAHGSAAAVMAANVALGLGIGLAIPAIMNQVVHSVDERRTSVFVATTTVSRTIGAALGAQVAAAIVIAAGVVPPGFPAERGYTRAFVLGLVASLVALAATVAVPGRASDPVLVGRRVAMGEGAGASEP